MPNPHRAPRRLVVVVAATTMLLLAGAGVVHVRADACWRTMQAEEDALRAQWRSLPQRREPLWGDATPTTARTQYDRAMADARRLIATDHEEMIAALRDTDEHVATARAALRGRWRPVVDTLRAGAHAGDASTPDVKGGEFDRVIVKLLDCRWVANAAVNEARALRHLGRGVEAVHHTLDVATFGADLLRSGVMIDQMIAVAILAIGTSEAWPERALARLDEAGLERLGEGLERLDRTLPERPDPTAELLFLADQLRRAPAEADWLPGRLATWRYGFSTRWMLADAFVERIALERAVAASGGSTWPKRRSALVAGTDAWTRSRNPLTCMVVPNLVAAEQNHREVLAQIRMLRLAVALHVGAELPPLQDPLGDGPIRVERSGDEVRLQCAGAHKRPSLSRTVRPAR